MWRVLIVASMAVGLGGCASGPLLENPLRLRPERLLNPSVFRAPYCNG